MFFLQKSFLARRRRRQTLFFVTKCNSLLFLTLSSLIQSIIYGKHWKKLQNQTAYTPFFPRKTAYTPSGGICVYAYKYIHCLLGINVFYKISIPRILQKLSLNDIVCSSPQAPPKMDFKRSKHNLEMDFETWNSLFVVVLKLLVLKNTNKY